jgi:uncharacterized membrane protein
MTLLASLVGAYALTNVIAPGLRTDFVAELFSAKTMRTIGHLGGGGIAIVAGALQFSTRLRFETPRVHRLIGRVYVVAVVVSGVSAVLLAPVSAGGVTAHFGFGLLGVLWVATALLAWARARGGDYVSHRAWMVRSYALCLAAVMLRLYLPMSAIAGIPFEAAYPAISWLCWVPNLIVAEWLVLPGSVAPLEPSA